MEEMMMVMMKIKSHQTPSSNTLQIPITTSTSPTWKLYENPFYISTSHQKLEQQQQQQYSRDHEHLHTLHLPISTRKIAASFWDLTFIKPFMESELQVATTQITKLKSALEYERKARKKIESLNKRLAKDLSEERKTRETLERVCEELARELSSDKAEINRMKKEMDDERKMLRTAEVIREERVQMKLAEAKMVMEEKLLELESYKKNDHDKDQDQGDNCIKSSSFGERLRFVLGEKVTGSVNVESSVKSMALMQRKACREAENPHIKRGIKGFVEFPKVVRAIGCRRSKHLGSKLECQNAQLKILLKQKGSVRFNGLVAS